MFDTLIAALESMWDALIDTINGIWEYLKTGYTWVLGLLVGLTVWVKAIMDVVYDLLAQLVEAIGNLVVPDGHISGAPSSLLEVANTFSPIVEGFVILMALAALWAAAIVYRTIKSWLPTLS